MLAMLILFISSLFVSDEELLDSMWEYQLYTSITVFSLQIIYFFYAQYEGKKYTSCTSCQIGNIIGTTIISFSKLIFIMLLSVFII